MSIITSNARTTVAHSSTREAVASVSEATAYLPARFGIAMTQVSPSLWRVSRAAGGLIGHIERLHGDDGDRFVAKRLLPRGPRYLSLGEYWSIDDAIDCFRVA